MASTKNDLESFCDCTLLSVEKQIKFKCEIEDKELASSCRSDIRSQEENQDCGSDPIGTCMQFLLKYEFIRIQMNENNNEINFISTNLGNACLGNYTHLFVCLIFSLEIHFFDCYSQLCFASK